MQPLQTRRARLRRARPPDRVGDRRHRRPPRPPPDPHPAPVWEWDGTELRGWIATGPTPVKRADLDHRPFVSVSYWAPNHDTCSAECRATWHLDLETRRQVWQRFTEAPEPLGYDPSIIPGWESPESEGFAVLGLAPFRLRTMPGAVMLRGEGEVLRWSA